MSTVYPQTAVRQPQLAAFPVSPRREKQLPGHPRQPAVMELPPEAMAWLNRKAYIVVQNVMRHMWMDATERRIFREDLMQEAFSHLYDQRYLQGQSEAYAYTAARTKLIGYVFVNIRGGGSGHQWELSKQYQINDNLTEPEYHEEDSYGHTTPRLPMTIYARRPTEDALVLHEGEAASDDRWERFEKEIARILAVMRGSQWHPNSLRRAAKALCESVKGTSNYNIAQILGVDWITATQIIIHYREQLEAFLAQSPVVQGIIRAEGELRLQWWEEVSEVALNSGQRFIVILPHGAFTVSYYQSKRKGKAFCRIQVGRRINGQVQNRSVQLGEVGTVTREKLWQKSFELQAKLAELEEATANVADAEAVARPEQAVTPLEAASQPALTKAPAATAPPQGTAGAANAAPLVNSRRPAAPASFAHRTPASALAMAAA
ncbi:MAG: hypothetical protein H6652_00110 [Ardenticatenaceae bacterium]|nr:hypothetical protein [Ardenticatenaceae bacterium]